MNRRYIGTLMKDELAKFEALVHEGDFFDLMALYQGWCCTSWTVILVCARDAEELQKWQDEDSFGIKARDYELARIYKIPAGLHGSYGSTWFRTYMAYPKPRADGREEPRWLRTEVIGIAPAGD